MLLVLFLLLGVVHSASVNILLNAFNKSLFRDMLLNGTLSQEAFNYTLQTASNASRIPHSYIIRLQDDIPLDVIDTVAQVITLVSGIVVYKYTEVIKGFGVTFDGELPMDQLRHIPYIMSITEDTRYIRHQVETVDNYLWGIDRLDQSKLPLD